MVEAHVGIEINASAAGVEDLPCLVVIQPDSTSCGAITGTGGARASRLLGSSQRGARVHHGVAHAVFDVACARHLYLLPERRPAGFGPHLLDMLMFATFQPN